MTPPNDERDIDSLTDVQLWTYLTVADCHGHGVVITAETSAAPDIDRPDAETFGAAVSVRFSDSGLDRLIERLTAVRRERRIRASLGPVTLLLPRRFCTWFAATPLLATMAADCGEPHQLLYDAWTRRGRLPGGRVQIAVADTEALLLLLTEVAEPMSTTAADRHDRLAANRVAADIRTALQARRSAAE